MSWMLDKTVFWSMLRKPVRTDHALAGPPEAGTHAVDAAHANAPCAADQPHGREAIDLGFHSRRRADALRDRDLDAAGAGRRPRAGRWPSRRTGPATARTASSPPSGPGPDPRILVDPDRGGFGVPWIDERLGYDVRASTAIASLPRKGSGLDRSTWRSTSRHSITSADPGRARRKPWSVPHPIARR